MHPFVANNIRATHYEIGPGGQARPTETEESFASPKGKDARFSLSNERIDFFKQSHFVIGSEGKERAQLKDKTLHDTALPSYRGQPKPNANQCSAYKIRFGRVQVGSPKADYPSNYVSSNQVQ